LEPIKTHSKSIFNLKGEFPSRTHWQKSYGTVDFLEINVIIVGAFFGEFAVAHHISLTGREREFFGPLLKKKTRAWWHQVHK
jgi:hypothetical protein